MAKRPKRPHRRLRVRAPLMRGRDIRELQKSLGVPVDGLYGPQTRAAMRARLYDLGASVAHFDSKGATRKMQRVVRGQQARPGAWLKRAVKRSKGKPDIVRLDVTVQNRFGSLGGLAGTVGHYTAGPRDTSDKHALALWGQYHAQHARQGWGGIGYHLGVTRAGTIVLLRPVAMKGAHTAGANTGRIGVVMHGTTGDRPTPEQQKTLRWLLTNAHTTAMPASHRAPRPLDGLPVWGHNDLNPTACPGGFKRMYTSHGKDR